MALLFEPLGIRGLTLANRIVIAPMCQYSARGGHAGDWHLVNLGRFATGGASLVFVEATAIEARGRITHGCTGLWDDSQIPMLKRIADFLKSQGAVPGIQLAHGGRKASSARPWEGGQPIPDGGLRPDEPPWERVGPSALSYQEGAPVPRALSLEEIADLLDAWRAAAERADRCGFEVLEIHGAHGYLIHQFLSSQSNRRNDAYGGALEGRMRFGLDVAEAVRSMWPEAKPLFFRMSVMDDSDPDWEFEDAVAFVRALGERGVDAVDCSSGGITKVGAAIRGRNIPGYQVDLAGEIRKETDMCTVAAGLIREPEEAERALQEGKADLVAIAREALYDPNWAVHAAGVLGVDRDFAHWPEQAGWWLERRAATLGEHRD